MFTRPRARSRLQPPPADCPRTAGALISSPRGGSSQPAAPLLIPTCDPRPTTLGRPRASSGGTVMVPTIRWLLASLMLLTILAPAVADEPKPPQLTPEE